MGRVGGRPAVHAGMLRTAGDGRRSLRRALTAHGCGDPGLQCHRWRRRPGDGAGRRTSGPDDVARTDLDTAVSVFVTSNDLDADGDGFSVVAVADPARGPHRRHPPPSHTHPTPARRASTRSRTTLRDSTGATSLGTLIVHVDSGAAAAATSPQPDIDYFTADQGSTVSFSAAELLRNDQDPQGQTLIVERGVRAGRRREPDGVGGDRLHVHAVGGAIVRQHRPRPRLLGGRPRRPRRPRAHPHPHPRRRRHQPGTRRRQRRGADKRRRRRCR